MATKQSFNGFVSRNGIGAPKKKKAEDDPGWDARKDGNKRGYYKGKWYGSPGPKVGKIPARRLRDTNSGRMPMPDTKGTTGPVAKASYRKPVTGAGTAYQRSRQGMRLRGTRPLGGGPGSLGPWSPRVDTGDTRPGRFNRA